MIEGITNDILNKTKFVRLSNNNNNFNSDNLSDIDYDSENMSLEKEEFVKDELLNNNVEEFLNKFQNLNLENKTNNKINLLNINLKPTENLI